MNRILKDAQGRPLAAWMQPDSRQWKRCDGCGVIRLVDAAKRKCGVRCGGTLHPTGGR